MQPCVALHPEGVDRNHVAKVGSIPGGVALHPEGVDRNNRVYKELFNGFVALHPEGVDRNSASSSSGLYS